MGGYYLLKQRLSGELAQRVPVVGVVIDDPSQASTHAN